jgi:uncharacterized surface protein with fasciclin (FAS1) repeats
MSPAAPTSAAPDSGISSGSDEAKGGRAAQPTIAAIAEAEKFDTLVYALGKAGLVETFKGSQQYTVFAPTDAAFDAAAGVYGQADGKALVDFLYDKDLLTPVLLYHVAQGDRRAQGLVSSGQVKMLDGNWAAVSVSSQGASIDGAPILQTDIIASNGIIHAIGGVMLPPSFDE